MPDSHRSSSDAPSALLSGAVAALGYVLRYGYRYGTGDHDDLLPPLIARLDPGLYVGDAYVLSQTDGVTVRTSFQIVVGLCARVLGLPLAVGLLHVATLVAVGAGLFALARAWGAGRLASGLGAFVAVALVPTWTLGGNALVYTLLTPEGMAWAFVVAALAAFARGRLVATALLLGVAAWLHALAGLLVLGVVGAILFWRRWRDEARTWGQVIGTVALGLFVAFALVVPALIRQSAEAGAALPDGLDPFTLYARLRFPHHLLPTAFGLRDWARFGVLVLAGFGGFHLSDVRGRSVRQSFLTRFAVASGVIAALAFIGVVAFESLSVARLQAFKLSVPVNALASLGVGVGLAALVPRAGRKRVESVMRNGRWALGLSLLAIGATGARVATAAARGPADDVAAWARDETPRATNFVVPPSLDGFRVPARRGAVVTWKAVPFRTDLAAEWWTRLTDVAPLDAPPTDASDLAASFARGYTQMNDADRQRLGDRYRAAYAILPLSVETDLPVAFEGRRFKAVSLEP